MVSLIGVEVRREQNKITLLSHTTQSVKLLVFLEFHHMVYVGCKEHTLFEAGE